MQRRVTGNDQGSAAAPIFLKEALKAHLVSEGGVAPRLEMLTNKKSELKLKVI